MKEPSADKLCKQYGDLISAYFDGQLTDTQMSQVEKHLRECPLCTLQLDHYRLIRNLITVEKQNSPVDLNATVMANLEREQLLTGLDELAKPPTAIWTRILRTFAAAAMIGLVVYAGSLVVQFAGTPSRPPAVPLASKHFRADRYSTQDTTKEKVKPTLLAQAKEIPVARKSFAAPAGPTKTDLNTKRNAEIPPTQPLVLRPSSTSGEAGQARGQEKREDWAGICDTAMDFMSASRPFHARVQSFDAQLPPSRTVHLWAPDLPSWMLLREQLLEILTKNNIPPILDPEHLVPALHNEKEFFYQARKGLDLAPGAACSEIFLVTGPENFRKIHAHLQQSVLDTIRQEWPTELTARLTTQPVTPERAAAELALVRNLEYYFARKGMGAGEQNQPTSTTSSAPSVSGKIILPILIIIEMPPHTPPTTTTTTTATSQTTQASQPTTRKTAATTQP
jgi:hypothetical protein